VNFRDDATEIVDNMGLPRPETQRSPDFQTEKDAIFRNSQKDRHISTMRATRLRLLTTHSP